MVHSINSLVLKAINDFSELLDHYRRRIGGVEEKTMRKRNSHYVQGYLPGKYLGNMTATYQGIACGQSPGYF